VRVSVCTQHDTTRTFFMTVEAPQSIRRGEQIGLRLDIFNNWDQDLEVNNLADIIYMVYRVINYNIIVCFRVHMSGYIRC